MKHVIVILIIIALIRCNSVAPELTEPRDIPPDYTIDYAKLGGMQEVDTDYYYDIAFSKDSVRTRSYHIIDGDTSFVDIVHSALQFDSVDIDLGDDYWPKESYLMMSFQNLIGPISVILARPKTGGVDAIMVEGDKLMYPISTIGLCVSEEWK